MDNNQSAMIIKMLMFQMYQQQQQQNRMMNQMQMQIQMQLQMQAQFMQCSNTGLHPSASSTGFQPSMAVGSGAMQMPVIIPNGLPSPNGALSLTVPQAPVLLQAPTGGMQMPMMTPNGLHSHSGALPLTVSQSQAPSLLPAHSQVPSLLPAVTGGTNILQTLVVKAPEEGEKHQTGKSHENGNTAVQTSSERRPEGSMANKTEEVKAKVDATSDEELETKNKTKTEPGRVLRSRAALI